MTADPLKQGPQSEQVCYQAMNKAAAGFPYEAVIGAAVNLIINAIRQGVPKRKDAEAAYDMYMQRGKSVLIDKHYDPTTGIRRSIFPYTQVLRAPLHVEDDEVRG